MTEKIVLKDFIHGAIPDNGIELAKISDRLWKLGVLDVIREKVCPDLFALHICINMIGCWQGDGWHSIISEQPELVPYIPIALETIDLKGLKSAFQQTVSVFPDFVIFKNDSAYCDAVNFLQNERFKIHDERLLKYSKDERIQMVKKYHACLDELEELTMPLWGDGTEQDGWGLVLDFVRRKHVTLQKKCTFPL